MLVKALALSLGILVIGTTVVAIRSRLLAGKKDGDREFLYAGA